MPKVTFRIGEGFPASDPVARFITVLGMMSNDWLRSMAEMLALDGSDPDSEARRVSLFRQQASLHHEAAVFIRDARRRFPDIDDFLSGLPTVAQDECDQVVGGIDSGSPHYHGDWLADHRNVTFHYPEMHPDKAEHGQEEIAEAVDAASELESSIESSDYFGSVRFRFADEVAAQWLPDGPEQQTLIVNLRESVLALSRFAQRAAQAYMESRPSGTFTEAP
jgi:hypothetical protein